MRPALAMLLLLALAGCGTTPAPVALAPLRPELGEPTSCVPYARARSGIALAGDAWQWWGAAAGRYARGAVPQPGSVLVLARSGRMRSGHLSVVTRVLDGRRILVDHANWASGAARGRIATDQLVVDVSARNDWSQVRVWYPPVGALGQGVYPTSGFIHPAARYARG